MKCADTIRNIAAIIAGIVVMYVVLFVGMIASLLLSQVFWMYDIITWGLLIASLALIVVCVIVGFIVAKQIVGRCETKWAIKGYSIVVLVISLYEFIANLEQVNRLNPTYVAGTLCSPVLMGITAAVLLLKYTKQSR